MRIYSTHPIPLLLNQRRQLRCDGTGLLFDLLGSLSDNFHFFGGKL